MSIEGCEKSTKTYLTVQNIGENNVLVSNGYGLGLLPSLVAMAVSPTLGQSGSGLSTLFS